MGYTFLIPVPEAQPETQPEELPEARYDGQYRRDSGSVGAAVVV